jgi:hypothetical protein
MVPRGDVGGNEGPARYEPVSESKFKNEDEHVQYDDRERHDRITGRTPRVGPTTFLTLFCRRQS